MRPVRWLAPPRVPPAQVEVCRYSDDNDRNNRIVQLVLSCDTGGKECGRKRVTLERIVVTQAKALISACLCPIHACAKCMNKTVGNCHQKTTIWKRQ